MPVVGVVGEAGAAVPAAGLVRLVGMAGWPMELPGAEPGPPPLSAAARALSWSRRGS